MSLAYIWSYVERALWFAVSVSLLWSIVYLLIGRLRKEKPTVKLFAYRALFVFYLAVLVQIVAIRDWKDFFDLTYTDTETEVILVPLRTTIRDAREMGILWECYHIAGNIAFFTPFGFLGAVLYPKLRTWRVMPFAVLGMSFFLEFMQWVFQTGVSDVDDLVLNTKGGCIGFWLWRLWERRRRSHG